MRWITGVGGGDSERTFGEKETITNALSDVKLCTTHIRGGGRNSNGLEM